MRMILPEISATTKSLDETRAFATDRRSQHQFRCKWEALLMGIFRLGWCFWVCWLSPWGIFL
ncbi:hypothetical protein L211DRAFT_869768, partial [Terfezia boudieri ATCC MYA-4762]